ncbi:hypothetical protein SLE2022_054410 [Rubroshorea leprosula]
MKSAYFLVAFALLALASSFASADDPSPLQDFCVAINDTKTGGMSSFFDIAFSRNFIKKWFDKPGNTSNAVGSAVTQAFVEQLPGLNTLGVSLVHIDFAPNGGLNPPHTHPRGTEILVVQEGTLFVSFVSSNQDGNRLFTKVLNKRDVFVFPIVFKSNPPINPDVLTKAFMLDKNVIKYLQSDF